MTASRKQFESVWIPTLFLVTVLGFVGISCSSDTESGGVEDTTAASFAVESSATKGPVTARVGLDVEELSIAEIATLRIELDARDDVELELPEPEQITIDPFQVYSYSTEPPRLNESGRVVASVTVELEPFLSGEYTIGPFAIDFQLSGDDPEPSGEAKVYTVEVEPLAVRVTSLTGPASADLDIRDLAPPVGMVEATEPGVPAWVFAAVGAGVLLLGALLVLAMRRKRVDEVERAPRLSPREAALQALTELEDKKLIENDQVQQFYFEICLILREFIEGEFGLRAAEETTEEFLAELVHETRFDGDTKTLLQRFLEHCDMVKFACYAPAAKEIDETVDVTRSFITRSQSASPPATAAASSAQTTEVSRGA